MERRKFIGFSTFSVVAAWIGTSAFSCAGLYSMIAGYVGAGIDALTSVVNLLSGAGIVTLPEGMLISAVLQAIKAGWADVTAAVQDYNNAPAAQKATLAGKVLTALQAVQAEIEKFWADLKIPDSQLASTVAGLLGLVVSTIAGFIASLPHPVPIGPEPAPVSGKRLAVVPKRLTQAQFRANFNQILAAAGKSQYSI